VPTDASHDDHTTAPLAGWVPSPTINGAPDLLATFPVSEGIGPAWGKGAIPGLYGAGEGAFRFTCGGEGELRYDDPLLYPGQPGKSHLHKFFGANGVTAATTSETLAAGTSSNCNYGTKLLNRSAYWMPALIVGTSVVNPDWIAVYYKRPMASSPRCTPGSSTFQAPASVCRTESASSLDGTRPSRISRRGSKLVLHHGSGRALPQFGRSVRLGLCRWLYADRGYCLPELLGRQKPPTAPITARTWRGLAMLLGLSQMPGNAPLCDPADREQVRIHRYCRHDRARLAFERRNEAGAKPGETMHGDYMEAWVADAKRMWLDGCINKGLDCSGGDLGNGLQLLGAAEPSYGWVNPRPRTPIPAKSGA
jgi:hypothetical protein